MPLYEYQCESCEKVTERIQKFSDPLMETCPACGGRVKKLFSSPAIQFKGSGWYITDYARKSADGKSTMKSNDKNDKPEAAASTDKTEKTDSSSSPSSSASSPSSPSDTKPSTTKKD